MQKKKKVSEPLLHHRFAPKKLSSVRYNSLKIGLLGGSFNPAHQGHLDLSLAALHQLKLDQIWWLVSPQNPLKSSKNMAGFYKRLRGARDFVRHPKVFVTDIENQIGTRYTAETLVKLQKNFPRTSFTWLMGADNLLQIPHWQNWDRIFETVSVAVFPRKPWIINSLTGKASIKYARNRVKDRALTGLGNSKTPSWGLVSMKLNPLSATALRLGNKSVIKQKNDKKAHIFVESL